MGFLKNLLLFFPCKPKINKKTEKHKTFYEWQTFSSFFLNFFINYNNNFFFFIKLGYFRIFFSILVREYVLSPN
jgi:hypothetical protein